MKTYLGVKLIKAEIKQQHECTNKDCIEGIEGYKVAYEDGYESWSPKEVFEKAYRRIDGLTFGLAIEAMRLGKCIARTGWNGKNMFVCKQVPSIIDSTIIPNMQSLPQMAKTLILDVSKEPIRYANQMIIVKNNKKGDRIIDSWVASSSDTFAEDWFIVE